ncbi:hypothetical protein PHET_06121 [Paragonimus heterotremus]|uniref:Uncharacterized protein n=1 Tax=Paragonimus heterotremus TaxID=100268 RepID=A0A8J4TED4_9TREM|nr:hypothetical protein PHET_06121 [Paragonimus heterotremus]
MQLKRLLHWSSRSRILFSFYRTCVDDSDKPDAGSTTMHSDDLRGGKRSRSFFNHCWSRFDRFYLMPLLTNRGPPLTDSVPWCCFRLAKLLTTTEQRSHSLENNSTSRINLCDSGIDRINLTGNNPAVLFVHDKQLANRLSLLPSLPSLQLDTATLEPQTYQTPRSDCFPSAATNTPEEQINRTTPPSTSTSGNALFIHQRLM